VSVDAAARESRRADKAAGLRQRRADLHADVDMTDAGPTQDDINAIRIRIT